MFKQVHQKYVIGKAQLRREKREKVKNQQDVYSSSSFILHPYPSPTGPLVS